MSNETNDIDSEDEDEDNNPPGPDAIPIALTVTVSEEQLRAYVLGRASLSADALRDRITETVDKRVRMAVASCVEKQIETAVASTVASLLTDGIVVGRTEWAAGTRKSLAQLIVERLGRTVRVGGYDGKNVPAMELLVAEHVKAYLDAEAKAVRAEFAAKLKAALDDASTRQIAELVQRMRKEP